ncbi:thioester reductase domain-containing protein [Rutstroemia sp. NJR-2017a WRK4]|nr:thioester reductase domain-containing protein [Rutstroemia sp. NJR-2017a WRK4]
MVSSPAKLGKQSRQTSQVNMKNDSINPSDRGRRLLPVVIDQLASTDPTRVFVSIPLTTSIQDGFRDITFEEISRAINRCAWWIEANIGRNESNDTFETINYIGPQDLSSPMNSADGHLSLLDSLECTTLLVPEVVPPLTRIILSQRQARTLTIQNLDELLHPGPVNPYPYTKTFDEARQDSFVVLHTSGSTGFPKPVILTHGTVAHHDTFLIPPPPGEASVASAIFSNKRVFIGLGLFHSAAMCSVAFAIYSNTTLVIPPPVPMTAELANQAHLHGNLDVSFLSPSILVDIAKNPSHLDNIRRLKHVTYGGGPLPRETGEMIRAQTHLFVNFGATETGYYPLLPTDAEDWEYMSFSSRMGIELRPFTGELYELVFIRNAELSLFQGVFSTFPTLHEYRTKDLSSKHPYKPGLWKFEGRSDDVIVCSTGQKVNPIEMEGLVNSHPSVVSAIVCGQGRERVSLLVEARDPPRDEDERAALIKELWPFIENVNDEQGKEQF